MSPENFCYWLQGFFEIGGKNPDSLTKDQIAMIRQHLDYVFSPAVQQTGVPIQIQSFQEQLQKLEQSQKSSAQTQHPTSYC